MSKETKTEISNNKAEELKKVLALIEKDLGKNSIMKLGDTKVEKIPVISSGSFLLDEALGVGGFPRGRIIEIYGPEQSGKTLSCLHLIAEAQRAGGNCAFIDAEHAFDRLWAKKNGVNVSELYFSQPNSGEHALTIVEYLLKSGTMDVIVDDSVAALTPQAELEGNMGDAQMALQARLMSQAMRKLTGLVSKSDCILVFINQLRDRIGVFWGSPETVTGGNALKFYASIRMDVRKKDVIKEGENVIGHSMKVKIVKNKVAPPFKEVLIPVNYTDGFDATQEIINISVDKGLITKAGSWFSYKEERIGQGISSVKEFMKKNPELLEQFKEIIRKDITLCDEGENHA